MLQSVRRKRGTQIPFAGRGKCSELCPYHLLGVGLSLDLNHGERYSYTLPNNSGELSTLSLHILCRIWCAGLTFLMAWRIAFFCATTVDGSAIWEGDDCKTAAGTPHVVLWAVNVL
jgi:hypothetical protein